MKSRKSRRARHVPGERFTMFPARLFTHQKWIELPPTARVILIDMSKRHHHGVPGDPNRPSNNGQIGYGCAAGAKAANVSPATAGRHIGLIRKVSLVKLRKEGSFNIKDRTAQTREWEIAIFPMKGRFSKDWPRGEQQLHLEHTLLNSAAYISLSNAGKCVLIELMRRFNGGNNGNISFGGADGHHIGFSTDMTERALTDVEAARFIVQTAPAIPRVGVPRKWRLTMYKADGKQATMDFLHIPKPTPENSFHGVMGAVDTPSNASLMRLYSQPDHGDFGDLAERTAENIKGSQDIPPANHTRTSDTVGAVHIRAGDIHLEASPGAPRFGSLVRALSSSRGPSSRPHPSSPLWSPRKTPWDELEKTGEIANSTEEPQIQDIGAINARTVRGRR
jgi:hypothetical protein